LELFRHLLDGSRSEAPDPKSSHLRITRRFSEMAPFRQPALSHPLRTSSSMVSPFQESNQLIGKELSEDLFKQEYDVPSRSNAR
jgi:hypothetical protein